MYTCPVYVDVALICTLPVVKPPVIVIKQLRFALELDNSHVVGLTVAISWLLETRVTRSSVTPELLLKTKPTCCVLPEATCTLVEVNAMLPKTVDVDTLTANGAVSV